MSRLPASDRRSRGRWLRRCRPRRVAGPLVPRDRAEQPRRWPSTASRRSRPRVGRRCLACPPRRSATPRWRLRRVRSRCRLRRAPSATLRLRWPSVRRPVRRGRLGPMHQEQQGGEASQKANARGHGLLRAVGSRSRRRSRNARSTPTARSGQRLADGDAEVLPSGPVAQADRRTEALAEQHRVPIRCRPCAHCGIPDRLAQRCRRPHRDRGRRPRQPAVCRGARHRIHWCHHRAPPASWTGTRVVRDGAGAGAGRRDRPQFPNTASPVQIVLVHGLFVALFAGAGLLFRHAARKGYSARRSNWVAPHYLDG